MGTLRLWLLALLCLGGIGWFALQVGHPGPVRFVFSGSAFASRLVVTGGSLDQPSLQKEFLVFAIMLMVQLPYIVLVRWLSVGASAAIRTMAILACTLVLVYPISVLVVFTWDLARYIVLMGVTPKRVLGIIAALLAYAGMAALAAWLIRPLIRRKVREVSAGVERSD